MANAVSYVAGNLAALSSYTQELKLQPRAANEQHDRISPGDDKRSPGAVKLVREKEQVVADPAVRAVAEKILRAFNTWAFKREQPSDAPLMLRFIADAVAAKVPVPFVLYWGKGPRHESGTHEAQCLDFLATLVARIKNVYAPGAAIKLILTDTHAELNGHRREHIQRYFDDIKAVAARRGFETCWLGHLVKAAGNFAAAAPIDEAVTAETLALLMASAQKWYHGSGTAQEGALTYLRMNLIEQRVVERTFPDSIFITFNGSELRSLFPRQLPIFYMYSLRRGVAVKPWFLPAESTPRATDVERAKPSLAG